MTTTEPTPGHSRPGRPKGWRKGSRYSKAFYRRASDTEALRSSIDVYKAKVEKGLCERLAPELAEGEEMPNFALALELVARSAQSALERLRAAERAYMDAGRSCVIVRREGEQLARREVYPRVVAVRRSIEGQFGRQEGRHVHGMAGKTRRKPRRLHGQLRYLVWALEDGEGELPAPLFEGVASKRREWLRAVKPGYQQLTALLDELVACEVAEQGALIERDQAMESFDAAYGEARRLLAANFAFAGLADKLTRLLRSYIHRRQLAREARRKRDARAEGRVTQTLRSAASSVREWIGGRPKNVA